MEHNNTGDELIEIIPDPVPEEDHDIKIQGSGKAPDARIQDVIVNDVADSDDPLEPLENTVSVEDPETSGSMEPPESAETSGSMEPPESAEPAGSIDIPEGGELIEIKETDEVAESADAGELTEVGTAPVGTESSENTGAGSTDNTGAGSTDNTGAGSTDSVTGASDPAVSSNPDSPETAPLPTDDEDIRIASPVGHSASVNIDNDDFSEELEEVELEQQDYEIMEEIGDAIINQVEIESWDEVQDRTGLMDGEYSDDGEGPDDDGEEPGDPDEPKDFKSAFIGFFAKLPKWSYILIGSALVVTIFMLWLTMSAAGQSILVRIGSKYIANKVTYKPVVSVEEISYIPDEDLEYTEDPVKITDIPEIPDDYEVVTPEITPEPTPVIEDKNVYNILIIGEENIDSSSLRGRSDLLMIASINRDQKKVKLTSILRDSLVSIPNHSDNKINAAYMIGGVRLLYDTLKVNLGIEFDNYCLVNFESFESIVDVIGGVDIELTAEEASYLNRTNYISKPEYRTVHEGINHMNGNQALGYCRIRKVPTVDLQYMDIGRTARQRRLMREIFDNVSKMNNVELMGFVNTCMPYLTTDITSEQLEQFIPMLSSISPATFEELRLPIEGSYHDVRLRGMLVTQIDLDTNTEALHKFIYGE